MKYPRIYEKWPDSETPDLFRLLENLNVLGLAEEKLGLPSENRVVHNPAELFSNAPPSVAGQPNLPAQPPGLPGQPNLPDELLKSPSNLVM